MITPAFVICSPPRCGSTTLYRALNLIPGVWTAYEPSFDDLADQPEAIHQRVRAMLADHSGIKHVFDPKGYPFRADEWVSIREMERDSDLWIELNSVILNYPGVRVVFLGRRDGFQRIVSDLVDRTTNAGVDWDRAVSSDEPLLYRESVLKIPLPPLDEELVQWYLKHHPRFQDRLRSTVTQNPALDLWYEDFFGHDVALEDRIRRFKELVAFLEISAPDDVFSSKELAMLLSPKAKLNDVHIFERIPNYHELCSKWEVPAHEERANGSPASKGNSRGAASVSIAETEKVSTSSFLAKQRTGATGRMPWKLRAAGDNLAGLMVPPEHPDVVRVVITKTSSNVSSDVQLNLPNLKVASNRFYSVQFRARADQPRTVFVGVAQACSPWLGLGCYEEIELSSEWRDFEKVFLASADEDQARIHFDVGKRAVSLELSQVRLLERDGTPAGGPAPTLPELDLGAFRRLTPISRNWGFDRGLPIDRFYIETFLGSRSDDMRGRVLEIEDDVYTRKFGREAVIARDVLDVASGNPRATIIADLTNADHIPSESFDCAIVTQTLQFIYDLHAAIKTLHRILKPGGVLLVTLPGITQIVDEGHGPWFWRFTSDSAQRLFGELFGAAAVDVKAYGNILTAISFLQGLAQEDLRQDELDYFSPEYEVIIAVRAVKAGHAT